MVFQRTSISHWIIKNGFRMNSKIISRFRWLQKVLNDFSIQHDHFEGISKFLDIAGIFGHYQIRLQAWNWSKLRLQAYVVPTLTDIVGILDLPIFHNCQIKWKNKSPGEKGALFLLKCFIISIASKIFYRWLKYDIRWKSNFKIYLSSKSNP